MYKKPLGGANDAGPWATHSMQDSKNPTLWGGKQKFQEIVGFDKPVMFQSLLLLLLLSRFSHVGLCATP